NLCFNEKMGGKVAHDGAIEPIEGLRPKASRKGGTYVLPITDKARGKLVIANVTVLFQFVPAPPESVRMIARQDFRPKLLDEDDPVFLGFLGLNIAFSAVLMIYVFNTDPREATSIDEIPDRFTEILLPPEEPEQVVIEETDDALDGAAAEEEEAEKSEEEAPEEEEKVEKEEEPEMTPEEAAAAEAARQQALQEEVMQKSKLLVGLLATTGANNSGIVVEDVFADGDIGANLQDALNSAGGVDIADSTTIGLKTGAAGGNEDATIGDLAKSGGGTSTVGSGPAAKVTGTSQLGAVEAEGGEADQIKTVLRKYSGQVQYCYEQRLKEDPSISGRIEIEVDIQGGRVRGVTITDNTTGDSALESCVTGKVRRWRFPADATMIAYLPFALSPG
ncbi:MAG: AgmX/PglI C-terminal domain-containing protein, partial [Myxococcota bacterium]|nr:AgmX/PglI C-terminal domain-containing protein [Myxococcota bacterium]